jgi:hypothetical protein
LGGVVFYRDFDHKIMSTRKFAPRVSGHRKVTDFFKRQPAARAAAAGISNRVVVPAGTGNKRQMISVPASALGRFIRAAESSSLGKRKGSGDEPFSRNPRLANRFMKRYLLDKARVAPLNKWLQDPRRRRHRRVPFYQLLSSNRSRREIQRRDWKAHADVFFPRFVAEVEAPPRRSIYAELKAKYD